ncbi:hypothetical protein [Actibacterium sp. MT2.3-13A]|uniref:hypothetical protein n=1 Tax=Actibacterium sp. MT2.3-13A TaxID=2828332 RepID=UPI001BADE198|nr:hypothetical protein [Actibacterium sp. MT2.3-13A]
MSEVVNFVPPKVVWVCCCGCSTFELRGDGEAECANCGAFASADDGNWYDRIKGGQARDESADEPFKDIQGNGSVEFARARIARLAADCDAVAIVVVKDDGRLHAWYEASSEDQVQWTVGRLDEAKGLLRFRDAGQ